MKVLLLILSACLLSPPGFAQETAALRKPLVDKRVELLSIVFRLAEKPEYTFEQPKLYTDGINGWFAPYKDHELIRYTKSIMYDCGLGYDAAMSMAIHLDGNWNLKENTAAGSLDERWTPEIAEKFVSLLKRFAAESGFERFFESNEAFYAAAAERFSCYENLDLEWFHSFFGQRPFDEFIVFLGPGNGKHNYGPAVNYTDGRKEAYSIIGTAAVDESGMPVYPENEYSVILIHEFCHSFVNRLNGENAELLRPEGERIFDCVKEQMTRQAYGNWAIMMNEALVRAAVVKYMKDHDSGAVAEALIRSDEGKGFVWISRLVNELDRYDAQRGQYTTLGDYIPVIAGEYARYADYVEALENKRPKVVSIGEFRNGDRSVKAGIKTITVNFDRPLEGNGYSVNAGAKGRDALPEVNDISYADGNRSVVFSVSLEKGRDYQLVLTGKRFRSPEGVAMRDYEINFSTAE